MENKMIEKLEAKGFKRWTKGNMDRLYINAQAMGLRVEYYKTGNVSDAWFNGERIINAEGRRMMDAKIYIDLKDGSLHVERYWDEKKFYEIAQALIDEVTAEIEAEEKAEAEQAQAVEVKAEEATEEKENSMNYTFIVYNKETLEKVGKVVTNHSINLDDAIDLLDVTRLEVVNSDDPDFRINGKEYWLDDLDMALETDYSIKAKFQSMIDKCVTKNGSGRECFSLGMLDDEEIKWMADNCPSWDWLDVTDDGGNNLLEIAQEKGYVQA